MGEKGTGCKLDVILEKLLFPGKVGTILNILVVQQCRY